MFLKNRVKFETSGFWDQYTAGPVNFLINIKKLKLLK